MAPRVQIIDKSPRLLKDEGFFYCPEKKGVIAWWYKLFYKISVCKKQYGGMIMKRLILVLFLFVFMFTMSISAYAGVKKVAVLTPYMASVTTNLMIRTFEKLAKEKGWKVILVDTKGDFGTLASRMEDMITKKVDAIVLGMADPIQLKNQVKMANNAGIPVFGGDAGYIKGMTMNVTSNNYELSAIITPYLFNHINDKGNIVTFIHPTHHGVRKRQLVMEAVLKEDKDVKVIASHFVKVPGPIEDARTAMESILLAHPKKGSINAVWAAWDEPAIGALQAIVAAGRQDEIVITGIDGTDQALKYIKQGGPFIATVKQDFTGMAKVLVREIDRVFSGKSVSDKIIYVPGKLITRSDLQ